MSLNKCPMYEYDSISGNSTSGVNIIRDTDVPKDEIWLVVNKIVGNIINMGEWNHSAK